MTTCLLGGLLGGCAFTDVPVTLPTSGFHSDVSGGDGREVVVVVPFSDDRAIQDRCGMQKNGYNQDTADAICQSDPNVWLAELLADRLEAAGFLVRQDGTEDRQGDPLRVEGALTKIFVEPVLGMWTGSLEADLAARLHVTTESGLEAERSFFVKGWKGGQMVSASSAYETALRRATAAMLDEMVVAVIDLVDRYPGVGRATSSPLAFRVEEVK